MASSLVPERLDVLLLWRLASTPPATPAALRELLVRYGGAADATDADVEAVRARLETRGLVHGRTVTEAGVGTLPAPGAGAAWSTRIAAKALPLHALGLGATVAPAKDGGWAALVLARHFGSYDGQGAAPSLPALAKVLAWRRLGLAGAVAKVIPAPILRALLAGLGGEGDPKLLARQLVGARNADPNAFRVALVRTWLRGHDFTTAAARVDAIAGLAASNGTGAGDVVRPPVAAPPAAESLEDFAARVRAAAAHAHTGLFGDRKVLISALFRELGGRAGVPDLEAFKHLLVEANRRGLLHLHRADFPEGLDEAEVSASATHYLHAVFHFVERQEAP